VWSASRREAKQLSAKDKKVLDDRGTVYSFDKLLLSTGGAFGAAFGGDDIIYYPGWMITNAYGGSPIKVSGSLSSARIHRLGSRRGAWP